MNKWWAGTAAILVIWTASTTVAYADPPPFSIGTGWSSSDEAYDQRLACSEGGFIGTIVTKGALSTGGLDSFNNNTWAAISGPTTTAQLTLSTSSLDTDQDDENDLSNTELYFSWSVRYFDSTLYNCPTLFNDTENKEIYWIGFPDDYVDGPSLCPTVDVSSTTDPTLEPLLTIEENDEDGGYFVKADFDPIADQPLSGTTGVWTVTLTYGLAPCGSTPNPGGDEENLDQNPVFGYPSDYRLPTLPTSQALPDTGSSTTNVMLAFGTVLIAAGGSIVIRSRRTRSI